VCARYGGEEFGVILPGTDAAGAAVLAEGLRRAVEALAVPHAAWSARVVTVSVGVAGVSPGDQFSLEELIGAADKALYDAKRAGRNRISQAPPAMDSSILRPA